jgi:hypothetical protein
MNRSIVDVLIPVLAFIIGGAIGLAFGAVQQAAKRKNEKRQAAGRFSTSWRIVPGSMTRISLFMAVLVSIQLGFPMIFDGNIQWIVSAGIIGGYGWMLLKEYRHQAAAPQN